MSERRSKRRSRSQRIGEIGESIFNTWGIRHNLNPIKVNNDYGIDFLCQVFSPTKDKEDASGDFLAVQVRSFEGENRKRIKLSNVDAENVLRMKNPFCLVAVDIDNEDVFYTFLDKELISILSDFLNSGNQTYTLGINYFSNNYDNFHLEIKEKTKTYFKQQLELYKVELNLANKIPGSQLEIHRTSATDYAIVTVPWITSIFVVDPKEQANISKLFFEKGILPTNNIQGVSLRPELINLSGNLVKGPTIFQGIIDHDIEITVKHDGASATAPFKLRTIGDERAYINETGLQLIESDPREKDGQFFHNLRFSFDGGNAKDLEQCKTSRDFIRLLRPNAKLSINNQKSFLGVEAWGSLYMLGTDLETIDNIYAHLNLDLSGVYLADFSNEEFNLSIALLKLLMDGTNINEYIPGITLGEAAENETYDTLKGEWIHSGFDVPIKINLKEKGVIIWLKGFGETYIENDIVHGFRFKALKDWRYKILGKDFSKTIYPELYIYENLPILPLLKTDINYDSTQTYDANIKHDLSGRIWLIST